MYVHRIEFQPTEVLISVELTEIAFSFLSALRMNGQVCGKEWPMYFEGSTLNAIVLTPDANSLNTDFHNSFVLKDLERLKSRQISVNCVAISKDPQSVTPCKCKGRSGYVLFTTYLSIESPLRCLSCFDPVPLYEVPRLASEEYYEIISWQSDYQNCDHLQMNCSVLEKAATRQISDVRSRLSVTGLKICAELTELTGSPVFYYLYRATGRSLVAEKRRSCPTCGSAWTLSEPLHSFIHFKCDQCRLVSNMGWNIDLRHD